MTMSGPEVTESLAGITSAMAADSYRLEVTDVRPGRLALRIDALDGACEECLAPASVMKGLVSGALGGRYTPEQIDITYPTHTASH